MKHLKLFENFTVEKDLFTEITEEEYTERNVDKFDIDKYINVLKSKYNARIIYPSGLSQRRKPVALHYVIIDVIEKRRDGTNGDNKLELMITLSDDDWFLVRMDEYEWMGSWRGREVDDDYTEPSYWKCDQIEGLMAFIDVVKGDIWGFMTR
jgi:hypothetical protein